MTLNEFNNKFFSRPTASKPTTLYIFTDENNAENWTESWIKHKYSGTDYNDCQPDMAIQSDMKLEHTLKNEWCNAEVQHFYAVEPDAIAVVVECAESEKNNRKIVQKANGNGNIQSVIIED